MMVALAMAYGRKLAARSAKVRMCCISISSTRSGDATLDPDSWNSLGALAGHLPSADAHRTSVRLPVLDLVCRKLLQHKFFDVHPMCATGIYRIETRVPPPYRE